MATEFTDELRYPIKEAILAALDAGVEPDDVLEECEHHIDNYEEEE